MQINPDVWYEQFMKERRMDAMFHAAISQNKDGSITINIPPQKDW